MDPDGVKMQKKKNKYQNIDSDDVEKKKCFFIRQAAMELINVLFFFFLAH